MMDDRNPHWYCVHTRAHKEAAAQANLRRQGFHVYLPRYLKRRRHARRTEVVATPFFPRYLFVELNLSSQRWLAVHSTFGVSRLVMNGDQPVRVPDQVISALRTRENAEGFVEFNQTPFKLGDKVRVLEGPFAECEALFEATTDDNRAAVLLQLLGQKVRLLVPLQAVAAPE